MLCSFGSLGLFGSKVTSHDLVSSALQAYMSIATAINHKFLISYLVVYYKVDYWLFVLHINTVILVAGDASIREYEINV